MKSMKTLFFQGLFLLGASATFILTVSRPSFGAQEKKLPVSPAAPSVASAEGSDAQMMLKELISAVLPRKNDTKGKVSLRTFSVKGCSKVEAKELLQFIAMGEPVQKTYRFGEGCDLDGTFTMTREPFPVDFKVRNVDKVSRLKSMLHLTGEPEGLTGLFALALATDQGKLFTKEGGTDFKSTYEVLMDYRGQLAENRGGKVQITEHNGKKVNITEKLHIPFK